MEYHFLLKCCSKCKKEKELELFALSRREPCGYCSSCKQCQKEYRENNKEKIFKYRQEHKKEMAIHNRNRRINQKEKINTYMKEYLPKYVKNRRQKDPIFKLISYLKTSVYYTLKYNSILRTTRSFNYVGKSGKELMEYLETLFKPGMTRDNHGRGEGKWHVDHIKPIASFDKSNENWLYDCFNYSNLQPLWEEENLHKSSIYEGKRHRSQ